MSNTYGRNIKISIFGQSHSPAIGVSIDGLPAGLVLDLEELKAFLQRRAPGQGEYATPRKEADDPEFLVLRENGRLFKVQTDGVSIFWLDGPRLTLDEIITMSNKNIRD